MMAAWQRRASEFFRGLDTVLLAISNVALVTIVVAVCWSVWSRYVLRSPLPWVEDVTSTAFAWFIFIAMAAVHDRRGHVGIDIVTSRLPEAAQGIVRRIADGFVAIFCAYAAYLCGRQGIISHSTASTTVLNIPLSFVFASPAIGFAVMALRSVGYVFGIPKLAEPETAG